MSLEQLNSFIQKAMDIPEVIDFLRHGNKLAATTPTDYNSLNYLGVNFKEDQIHNIKFYFAFSHDIPLAELEPLLPISKELSEYLPHWESYRFFDWLYSPISFAIKVDRQYKLTYQFHLRFPFHESLLPKPKHIELTSQDLLYQQGISYEYTGTTKYEKLYYYLACYGS